MSLSRFRSLVTVAAGALVACTDGVDPTPAGDDAVIRVLNATAQSLDVLVDGAVASSGIAASTVSSKLTLASGQHTVQLRAANGATATLTADAKVGETRVVVATAAGPGLGAAVLADTGAIVRPGKSKMRLVHLAPNAPPVESWRTQPDFQTPTRLVTPTLHGLVSPYFESDAGSWEVWVTAVGATAKLATTGSFTIPDGQRRTVALVDSAGSLRMRVIEE